VIKKRTLGNSGVAWAASKTTINQNRGIAKNANRNPAKPSGDEKTANGTYVPCPPPAIHNEKKVRARPYKRPITFLSALRFLFIMTLNGRFVGRV
jgi:hypothetical protein